MQENYYFVELDSFLEGLFEQLDDYGFDYYFDAIYPVSNVYTAHYPYEFW